MGWFTAFLVVLFLAFLATLIMGRQLVPMGTDWQGHTIVVTHVSIGRCFVLALVMAVLVTLLLYTS